MFILESGPIQPAVDQIATAARAAGWTLTPRDAVGYSGRKDVDGIDAWLIIARIGADKTVWLQILSSDTPDDPEQLVALHRRELSNLHTISHPPLKTDPTTQIVDTPPPTLPVPTS